MSTGEMSITSQAVATAPDKTEAQRFQSSSSKSASNVVRVGVIGYGYWGPNIVRNFHSLDNCQVVTVCDKSTAALRRASKANPSVRLTTDFSDVLTSPEIDAVAIVTPVWTHYELAKAALCNGKHVFV